MLNNARSIKNKTSLIHNLIMDVEIDPACITETWVTGRMDVFPYYVPQGSDFETSLGCGAGLLLFTKITSYSL